MHVHDTIAIVTGFGVGAATDGALAPGIMKTAMVATVTEEFRAALAAVVARLEARQEMRGNWKAAGQRTDLRFVSRAPLGIRTPNS